MTWRRRVPPAPAPQPRPGATNARLPRRLEVLQHLSGELPRQIRGLNVQSIDLSDPERPELGLPASDMVVCGLALDFCVAWTALHARREGFITYVVLDACRDNPFRVATRAARSRGLAPTSAATGQMIIFSAGTGQQALDKLGNNDTERNGLFTRLLLREMKKPGQSIDRIVRSVRTEVARLAKTVGHEQTPAVYDQTLGDFYFIPLAANARN